MIPQRIMLKGFLCYRDEQEVVLDESTLWMMAGLNGSGKSAIFDAMTFALFGHHRGGGQQIVELINHDSEKLNVEFDFTLDGQNYRVRRTATRQAKTNTAKTTQQVLRLKPDEIENWEAIENTSGKRDFDNWIHEHIGLNYDTFTSSVLLLQGRAEKLLDSTASGRFEVLAGIVDLERYRRLHERADSQRKELKIEVETLKHQLEGLPIVTEEELGQVDESIRTTEQQIQHAQAAVTGLIDLEQRVRQWAELQAKRAGLEERWRLAEKTLGEAAAIQKDLERLRELNDVLPYMTTLVERRARAKMAAGTIEQLAAEEQSLAGKIQQCEHTLEQARRNLANLQKRRDEDETKHREVHHQLRELSGLLTRVKLCEQQRETLQRQETELKALPADLNERLLRLREERDKLAEVERAVPLLSRLFGQRVELRQARDTEASLGRQEQERVKQGEQLKKKKDALQKSAEAAEKRRQEADGQAVEAKTLFERARTGLKDFVSLEGAQVCRQCGQALTPGHFEEEKRKREREVEQAKRQAQQADEAQKRARAEEARSKKDLQESDEALVTARDDYRDWKRNLDEVRRTVERLTRETAQAVADLAPPFRDRAAGAGADGEALYPSEADLARLREQSAGLETVRNQLREMETLSTRWQALKVQVEQTRLTLQSLEADLPGDVGALRRKHVQMEAQELTLASSLKALRQEEREAADEIQRLGQEKGELHKKRTDVAGQLKTEDAQRKMSLDEVERIRQKLSPAWQKEVETAAMAEIHRWSGEREKLLAADTEGKAKQLEQARFTLESLKHSRVEVAAECDRFPAEARIPAGDVQRRLVEARAALLAQETGLRDAQRRRAILDSQRQQREGVQKRQLEQSGAHIRYSRLAELLGREYLQRHLVRQAERQVVDHANAVLDRLSGGQLYLKLRGGDGEDAADKALELEAYNRSTASDPINVAFLSGSQRFRVAVSLALGLGQYASRQHRPIESVIIDEGFGCLDRQGRQVMIQELQNLRGQLRCILLVSHQEEFAEAFSDGYLFELNDGATQVKRFPR